MDMFADDMYHNDEEYESADEGEDEGAAACEHELLIEGYCALCGVQVRECLILNDEIITDSDKLNKRKEFSNENLLNVVSQLQIPKECRGILTDYISKNPIKIRGNSETVMKVLCYYSYKLLLVPMIIECSFFRFFEFCGINKRSSKKVIKYIRSIQETTGGDLYNISFIHPIALIKEFLYIIWMRENKELEPVPLKYKVPPGHKDIIMFAAYLFSTDMEIKKELKIRLIKNSLRKNDEILEAELDEFVENEYQREYERRLFHNGRKDSLTDSPNLDELIEKMYPDEYMVENPHRLAACILYNVLMISMSNLSELSSSNNTILKRHITKIPKRMYNEKDVVEYFGTGDTTIKSLISKYGIRIKNNISKKN